MHPATLTRRTALRAIGVVLVMGLVADPAAARWPWSGKTSVARVAVAMPPLAVPVPVRPVPPPAGGKTCIDATRIAGAQVFGDTAVELTLQGGARWRMYFAQACPTLSFYTGFYYRRAQVGRLCAGRDAVIVRSGGECAIASIMPLGKVSRHRR